MNYSATKIRRFNEFEDSDILYIFDFDETLVRTPSFEELAINFLKESNSVKDMLQSSVDRIGADMSDIKWENGRLYIKDPEFKIKITGNWIRKGKRVYLLTPNKFPFTDISLPTNLKEMSSLYNKVDNKCIVTARPEDVRPKILNIMSKFGLENPKYGLHMFPAGKGSGNSGIWKGERIVEIIKKTGFKKVHFYEDNSKILNRVKRIVNEKLPEIEFTAIKVK